MAKCSFCKTEITRGTGKQYVQNSGKVLWLCSKKCEVNMLTYKRSPFRVKWVKKAK